MYTTSSQIVEALHESQTPNLNTQQCFSIQNAILSSPGDRDPSEMLNTTRDAEDDQGLSGKRYNGTLQRLGAQSQTEIEFDGRAGTATDVFSHQAQSISNVLVLSDQRAVANVTTRRTPCTVNGGGRPVNRNNGRDGAVHQTQCKRAAEKLRPHCKAGEEILDASVVDGKCSLVVSDQSERAATVAQELVRPRRTSPLKMNIPIHSDSQIEKAAIREDAKQTQASWSPTIPNDSTPESARYHLSTAEARALCAEDEDEDPTAARRDPEGIVETQSTAGVTYNQNDTGFVNFDIYNTTCTADPGTQTESQRTPYAPLHVEQIQQLQTPVPLVNPFTYKGSVMKGHELFAATQPSAFKGVSPTSSRPSPDLHKVSPQQTIPSSPLQRYETHRLSNPCLSPISSSNPVSDFQTKSFPESGARQRGGASRQPRDEYVPMAQSQERRREATEPDSEDDFFEMGQEMKKWRHRKRKNEIAQQELKAVKSSVRRPTSSEESKAKPSSALVEVPSTSRHRSVQDGQRGKQYRSSDARGSQEVIHDSQSARSAPPVPSDSFQLFEQLPGASTPKELPLKGVSNNCNSSAKVIEGVVPETSPSDQIKPLTGVASFSVDNDTPITVPPGFTPDKEFNRVMDLYSASPLQRKVVVNEPEMAETSDPEGVELSDTTRDAERYTEQESRWTEDQTMNPRGHDSTSSAGQPLDLRRLGTTIIDFASIEKSPNGTILMTNTPSSSLGMSSGAKDKVNGSWNSTAKASRTKDDKRGPSLERQHSRCRIVKSADPRSKVSSSSWPRQESARSPNSSKASTPLSSPPGSSAFTSSATSTMDCPQSPDSLEDAASITNKSSKRNHPTLKLLERRSSKRRRQATEESEDPLAMDKIHVLAKGVQVFKGMAFSVTFLDVSKEKQKKEVYTIISRHGGVVLEDGFQGLFTDALVPTSTAQRLGFTAVIADRHSRKAKYMQALALGLPCLSYRWVLACANTGQIINWAPYLLCAGESVLLAGSLHSRLLQPYGAGDVSFAKVVESRPKLLDGISLLSVKSTVKSKDPSTYAFLIRALAPVQLSEPVTPEQARKILLKAESDAISRKWDLLYMEKKNDIVEKAIFGPIDAIGNRKRKRGPMPVNGIATPTKRIRIIDDECIIQSLIAGHLIDD